MKENSLYYRHLHKTKSYSPERNLISCQNKLSFNSIYNLKAVGALVKIFMGLALVRFQKYWLLSNLGHPYLNFLSDALIRKYWCCETDCMLFMHVIRAKVS